MLRGRVVVFDCLFRIRMRGLRRLILSCRRFIFSHQMYQYCGPLIFNYRVYQYTSGQHLFLATKCTSIPLFNIYFSHQVYQYTSILLFPSIYTPFRTYNKRVSEFSTPFREMALQHRVSSPPVLSRDFA
jgi:hypothetical protein